MLTEFWGDATTPDGKGRWCKRCNEASRQRQKLKPRYWFSQYERNARDRGLEFSLTIEDFEYFWGQPCVYCGEQFKGLGFDRIDNDEGYVRDNVMVCCPTCNAMKSDLGLLAFVERCHRIASRLYLGTSETLSADPYPPVANASIARHEAD